MRWFYTSLLILLGWSLDAGAQTHPVQLKTVASVDAVEPGDAFELFVRLDVEPGWHIYWENPGELGEPTQIKWSLPDGVLVEPLPWPAPKHFKSFGIVGYGYEDELVVGYRFVVEDSWVEGASLNIGLQARWLACADVCIPGEASREILIPVAEKTVPNAEFEAFNKAQASWPQDGAVLDARLYRDDASLLIEFAKAPLGEAAELYFFDRAKWVDPPEPQVTVEDDEGYRLELALRSGVPAEGRLEGILTNGQGAAWDLQLDLTESQLPPAYEDVMASSEASFSLWKALLFAFIGGMILNLMPCVFPVVGLKLMGFVRQAGHAPAKIKWHGWAFAAGVILSFWVLAGLLLALRASGESLGWGFQLQNPVFVYAMMLLLFSVGLNFAGLFEVGTSLVGVGGGLRTQSGYRGSFFSGILATLVATPCTAPFMGAALGYALTLDTWGAMSIFTALALGLALPYVLLSSMPGWLAYLPKPGAWMERFKQSMAFLMFAAVVWLIWVLGSQIGMDRLAAVLMSLVLLALGWWIYGQWAGFSARPRGRWLARFLFLVCALGAAIWGGREASTRTVQADELQWLEYSPELIEELQSEERPVYIDFTAAWCTTCWWNKKVVFGSQEVRDALKAKDVALVKGDWTTYDPMITEALQRYGRSGVPTNVVYTGMPGGEPVVLSETLTPGIVLDVLALIPEH